MAKNIKYFNSKKERFQSQKKNRKLIKKIIVPKAEQI
jgi:hypothetical protein